MLWDVPAQYGFLSTLAIAFLPFGSTWQTLYVLNVSVLFASACILYAVLRASGSGWLHRAFCLAVSGSSVFLIPGPAARVGGVQMWPSVGAFRFIWCYVLVGIVLWCAGRAPGARKGLLWLGSFAWLLGSLWSSESLVYSTAIWWPALVLFRADDTGGLQRGFGSVAAGCGRALLTPMALLAGTLLSIGGWYLLPLGHLPDLVAFFGSALAFSGDFSANPLHPNTWVAMLVAAWTVFWATGSYVVGHSNLVSITNLTPILCLSLGALLMALRSVASAPAARLIRAMAAPVFVMVLFAPLSTRGGPARVLRALDRRVRPP